jgi:hypothetical protein
MLRNALALSLSAVTTIAFGAATSGAGVGPSRADAESLRRKVTTIVELGTVSARQPRRTMLTENEVNAYLTFDAMDQIPSGVVEPAITIAGGGRVSARAVVDLDAVRKQKSQRSLLDPMNYVTGRVPVTAIGMVKASDGVGRVEFESAAIGSIPVPKLILQEIVSYYSRSPERPAGIGLDDSYALPARIQAIQFEPGRAIIVQ